MDTSKLILVALAGCSNRGQQLVTGYLLEEVRILKELGGKRHPQFTDGQRGRPARKAKRIRFSRSGEIGRGTIAEVLRKAGMGPAPERGKKGTWAGF